MDDFEVPDTGAVFTFGRTRFADNKPSHFFIKNDPVVDVACGDEHTVILCQNGRLFAFGSNEYGQLGLGHTETVTRPSCIKSLKPSKGRLIVCGRSHSIVVTENNQIFTFGNNSDGQLGHGNIVDCNVPTKIDNQPMKLFDRIVQIAAGSSHSAFLTDKGRMYVWGSNTEHQLGLKLDAKIERVTTPTMLRVHERIKFISCGYYHTGFITESGKIFMFGENDNGKLGLHINGTVAEPTKLIINSRFVKLFCGGHHTFFISSDNEIYACGLNINGQLGVGEDIPFITQPTKLNPEFFDNPIQFISCGDRHSAFITRNGKLYTCGDSRHGKLCQTLDEDIEAQRSPLLISKFESVLVTNVSCGGCHTVVTIQKRPKENPPVSKQPAILSPMPSKVLLPKIEDLKNVTPNRLKKSKLTEKNTEHNGVNGNWNDDEDSRDESQREFELLEQKFEEEEKGKQSKSRIKKFIENTKIIKKHQQLVRSLKSTSTDSTEKPKQKEKEKISDKSSVASLSIKDVPDSTSSDNSDNESTTSSSDAPDSEVSQSRHASTSDIDNKDLKLPKDVKNIPNSFQNKVSRLLNTIKTKRIFTDTNFKSTKNSANKVAPNVQNIENDVHKAKSKTCSIL